MTIETVEGDDLAKAMKIETIVDLLHGQFGLMELNRLRVAEKGDAALDELRQRYDQLSRNAESLAAFFDRRKREVESHGGHLRGEIEDAESDAKAHLRDAKRYLDAKQSPTAQKALDQADQSIKVLQSMK